MIKKTNIEIEYKYTTDVDEARVWLNSLPKLFSADFETAVKYSDKVISMAKDKLKDPNTPKIEKIHYKALVEATPLGHPSHCVITHCSIAISETFSYVFIIDSDEMHELVTNFLVTTEAVQIWHNYSYDGRFLRYFTGKDAKNVEDTQILAKTLINHVETYKAKTGLKELAGSWYGDWGISSDLFKLSQMYETKVIKYAGIDACATFKLWTYMQEYIGNA